MLRLERRPGHYLVKHQAMMMVWPGDRVTEALAAEMNAAFVLGNQRTAAQDVEFSFHQLVEIAVRALSPGISDPFTAIGCVDRIGSALCRLAQRHMPSPHRFDSQSRLRLVAEGSTFAGAVDAAFNQIRQNARSNPAVAIRMLDAITQIASHVQNLHDADCLRRHAGMIVRGARESVPEADDLRAVEARFDATTRSLRERYDGSYPDCRIRAVFVNPVNFPMNPDIRETTEAGQLRLRSLALLRWENEGGATDRADTPICVAKAGSSDILQ